MNNYQLFTSESVCEGHPDKIADQISDAVLDAILTQDPNARVACETFIKTGMVLVGGEITTHAWVDIEQITRQTIRNIGYTHSAMGFDWESCAVITAIGKQSPDIAQGVDQTHEQGAGDQGLMFGYASDETPELMPAPVTYAHQLAKKLATLRQDGTLPWLRPDGKTQVTVAYQDNVPVAIDTIVISAQHAPEITQQDIKADLLKHLIASTDFGQLSTKQTRYLINPTGRFVIGGPLGDTGLTGRKIIVDTYGGMARHGGGCFSGKDPSKVDRSGSYMARYIAKNIVAAGLAKRCEIQISYAIGVAQPTSISVETFGTTKLTAHEMLAWINQHFDLRPRQIINQLNLLQPIYLPTATYGHFGRNHFPWEQLI